MKLPLDVRYKIFKILVAPLSGGRNQDIPFMPLGHGIRFKISDGDYDPAAPELDFDLSTDAQSQYDCISEDDSDDLSECGALQNESTSDSRIPSDWTASMVVNSYFNDTPEDSSEEMSEESSDEDQEMSESSRGGEVSVWHPIYDVRVDRAMEPDLGCKGEFHDIPELLDDCTCFYRQRQTYDSIRSLSHISRQFTRELGECLWQNAIADFEDLECFFPFIRDHTATLRHIKGLILNIQYYEDYFDTRTYTLSEICKFVSENLNLRFIIIRFATQGSLLNGLLATERVREWGAIFRSLQIQEKFDLRLVVSNVVCPTGAYEIRRIDPEKFQQKLLDLWLPDTLKQAKSTEEEVYRLSRAQYSQLSLEG
jgi:hypothetical protein